MIPSKLKKGDLVRVIAPSHSFSKKFTEEMKQQAVKRLESLGLRVSFGKYVNEHNDFSTATVEHRLEDLHEAISDPAVKAVIPAQGGSSANQLLKHIDYSLLKQNPKIFCGLSDITELSCAIYAQTDLITYYGPHFTMLGASRLADYTLENMKKTFFSDEPVDLAPAEYYSNTEWEQEKIVNEGFWALAEGEAEAGSIGGNLLTISMLAGGAYVPPFEDTILFLEDNKIIDFRGIQKELQAILNHPGGDKIRGLIFGRFQRETGMTRDLLCQIIRSKEELRGIPAVGNVDFGHTAPSITLPIGGRIRLKVKNDGPVQIQILEH